MESRRYPLPNGLLELHSGFLEKTEADMYFDYLLERIAWQKEKIRIFGREVWQPRLTAWYGDPGTTYTYSGLSMHPQPWDARLLELKSRIEAFCGHRFNSVLLNRYRDGQDSMGWHSDDEPELGANPFIASLSLGATRRFRLRPRKDETGEPVSLDLTSGSLLLMGGALQHHWQHCLPKTRRSVGIRINLTFRQIYPQQNS